MTDVPTTNNRLRKQSLGSNTNTWGDTKLNEVLDAIDQAMDGCLQITLASSADYTLNTTNYTIADEAKNRVLRFTGTLSSAVNVIVPSVEHTYTVVNACGATLTIKTSAGTGVSIPTGYQAYVYCDGANVNNGSPTVLPGSASIAGGLAIAGQINGLTAAVLGTDAVNLTQMSAAIASAAVPGANGTVRATVLDTTPGYLQDKLTLNGVSITPSNPGGGNQVMNITVDEGQLSLTAGVYGL